MDETTKVLIGTISGFIIAFLAEPVKTYFQNRAKLRNLRVALYKEMVLNYIALENWVLEEDASNPETKTESDGYRTEDYVARYALRTECYKHAIQNELELFYQLREALAINLVQGQLVGQIFGISSDLKDWFGEEGIKKSGGRYVQLSGLYRKTFLDYFRNGTFNRKLLKRIVNRKIYQDIIRKGKESSQTNPE